MNNTPCLCLYVLGQFVDAYASPKAAIQAYQELVNFWLDQSMTMRGDNGFPLDDLGIWESIQLKLEDI